MSLPRKIEPLHPHGFDLDHTEIAEGLPVSAMPLRCAARLAR